MRKEETDPVDELTRHLREAADGRFAPGFADRVMDRIASEADIRVVSLTTPLRGQFLRLAPLAAAVLVALGAYNLIGAGASDGRSPLEAALGLEPVTLETAYAFEPSFYPAEGE